jgi:hypothetical protein
LKERAPPPPSFITEAIRVDLFQYSTLAGLKLAAEQACSANKRSIGMALGDARFHRVVHAAARD